MAGRFARSPSLDREPAAAIHSSPLWQGPPAGRARGLEEQCHSWHDLYPGSEGASIQLSDVEVRRLNVAAITGRREPMAHEWLAKRRALSQHSVGIKTLWVMENHSYPTTGDHHFRREDRVLRWKRIAGHIAEHPADLSIALENIDRWLALGRVHPAPLLEWQDRIHAAQYSPQGFRDFITFLAEEVPLLVLGSATLLASFPELGDPQGQGPLASTYVADLCPDPRLLPLHLRL